MSVNFIIRIALNPSDCAESRTRFKARISALPEPHILEVFEEGLDIIIGARGGGVVRCIDQGLILGTLFRRDEQQATTALTAAEQQAILTSRGQYLIEKFWGPYIAILRLPDRGSAIIRAPWGDLPCYRYEKAGAIYLASDVGLLVTCSGYQPSIAWDSTLQHLAHGIIHPNATCLAGIEQLPGGERFTVIGGTKQRETLWSPWTFALRERPAITPEAAAHRVQEAALHCIGARASQFEHVMVTLSGGLDSSIVSASLAARQVSFSAMTLVTHDAAGDEFHHAQSVSEALSFRLTSHLREVARIDVRRSGAKGRPFPCVQGFFVESMRLADEAANARGADAIFNGSGGDTLFCSMQSGSPVADRLLSEGVGKGFLQTASAISQLAPASIPAVLRDAVARAWFGRPAYRHRPRVDFLTEAARELAGTKPSHPWFANSATTLPGKAFHIWGLAYFKAYVECLDPNRCVPIVAPLLSQPLIEACLAIPSWLWFEAGLNRMVARRAFNGLLPPDILSRRSKGTPSSFSFEIIETHRQAIRDMLVEGQLARQGLIDLPGLVSIIDADCPLSDALVDRVLALLDVEAWAASWSRTSA